MILDDRLADLWQSGATFTDMGLKLGESRNVIAGRIDRARRAGDPRFAPRPKPVAAPIVASEPAVVAPVEKLLAPLVRPVPFAQLQPGCCRWPVNSPERGGVFLCCSAPVAKLRGNYCEAHARVSVSASLRAPGQRRNGGNGPASLWTPQDLLSLAPSTGCSALPFGDGVLLSVSTLFGMKDRAPVFRLSLVDIECAMVDLHCRGQHIAA